MRSSVEGLVEEEPYQVEEAHYLNANRSYTFKPNPTCQHTIHQHLGTMKTFHMVEKHNRALDLDKITIRLMISLGSNSNNNNNNIGIIE